MTESKGNISISPLTGRYTQKTIELWEFFSEFAFIKYRIRIEIEYLIKLRQTIPELKDWKDIQSDEELRQIYKKVSSLDIETIKRIETQIKHDVKSIEYYIKKKVPDKYKEFVHFALTSQDVNNPAISLSVKECLEQSIYPKMVNLIGTLKKQHSTWKDIAILSRTHGQPATTTTLGKELAVFHSRLERQMQQKTIFMHKNSIPNTQMVPSETIQKYETELSRIVKFGINDVRNIAVQNISNGAKSGTMRN